LELLLAKLNIDRKDFFVNYKENETAEIDGNVTDNVTDRKQLIIFEIAANNKITTVALATKLKVTKRTILREIELLKKDGILKRDGNEKTGSWVICKDHVNKTS